MPRRTCIGCGLVREKGELLRFVTRNGLVKPDPEGMLPGRGGYLCPSTSCVDAAYKKKDPFSRALRQSVKKPDKQGLLELVKTIRKGRLLKGTG